MKKNLALFFILAVLFVASPTYAATILNVPFTAQAPQNQWRTEPFQDACEEATIIMAEAFYYPRTLSQIYVRDRITLFSNYEMKQFGFYKDTSAAYTARLTNELSKIWGHVVENPSVDDVKAQIDSGHPVMYMAYAPALHNPRYSGGHNPYHVLLIIGYDDEHQQFITNDPGTRIGKGYRYSYTTIINANHDYMSRNNGTGAHVMIFTER